MRHRQVTGELSDEEYITAIRHALDEGARDLCDGGVAPVEIAERVGRDTSTVRRRCNRLCEAGRLDAVEGVAPGTLQPRTGYLPTLDE